MIDETFITALLAAPDDAARRVIWTPPAGMAPGEFFVAGAAALKAEADVLRLRDPQAALRIAALASEAVALAPAEVAPQCRALAAWARGNVLIHLGEYAECLEDYQQAEQYFATAGADLDAARLRANQAFVLKNLGRYAEGIAAAQSALAILRRYPSTPFLGSALNALATLYQLTGRHGAALAAYAECAEVYATDPVRLARLWINQANVLEDLDRFGEAETLLTQARDTLAAHDCTLEVVRADLNLGVIATRRGRYDTALAAFARATEGFTVLDNAMEVAVVALYRADLYAACNLDAELLAISTENWQTFTDRAMQWQAARAALHQAVAWQRLGDLLQAESRLARARQMFVHMGDELWAHLTDLAQATLAYTQGDYERVQSLARVALIFFQEHGLPLRAAECRLLLTQSLLALGQTTEAAAHCQDALTLAESLDAPALAYQAQHGLGCAALAQGQPATALTYFRQAVTTIESLRQRVPVEEFRLGFLEDKLPVYRDAILTCLDLGLTAEALHYVERAKSGALVDLLLARLAHPDSDATPPDRALAARLEALREALNWHHSKLPRADTIARGMTGEATAGSTWAAITALEREMGVVWRDLQQRMPLYPAFVSNGENAGPPLTDVLAAGDVLLHYYLAEEHLYAFVLTAAGLQTCVALPASLAQITASLEALDITLGGAAAFADGYIATTLTPLAQQQLGWLYTDLLAPLTPWLADAERLLIAPDGRLFEVPFHALYDGTTYLLERYPVAYTPGALALQVCRANAHRRGVGTPAALLVGQTRDTTLPFIRLELAAVAQALPETVLLTGEAMTLAQVQQHAPHCAALHLATHAVFRRDNPLFSALALAEGEWLRGLDLYALRLNGALVTLSGCETGRQRLLGGDLVGLSRGFLGAGAAALLVSLWPVDDSAAARVMSAFYTRWAAGAPAASALREAQREMMHEAAYRHPFYWAPFCILGDPDVRWQ